MNNVTRFLKAFGMNALAAYLFYAWKFEGSEGSGNLVLFWFWFSAVVGILVMFAPASGRQPKRIKWLDAFNRTAFLLFILAFACFGHFALAACSALSAVGWCIYRDKFDDEGMPLPKEAK